MIGYTYSLITSQVDGTALTNTTTATTILPGQAKFVLPPNFVQGAGQKFTIKLAGRMSTVTTTPGTLTIDIRLVSTAGTVIAATSPAFALNTTAKTNISWTIDWDLTTRTVGSGTAAAFMHQGKFASEAVIASPVPGTGGSGILLIPASAPAVGTGWDSTLAQQFDVFGTWSVANAANSILVHQYELISNN